MTPSKFAFCVSLILISFGVFRLFANPANDAPAPVGQFDEQLLEIASRYIQYGRVDDEARWAPFLCRRPKPSVARLSASEDAETHGQKMYFLFAKQRRQYMQTAEIKQPVGQAIVKESWVPRQLEEAIENPHDLWAHVKRDPVDRAEDSATAGQIIFKGEGRHYPYIEKEGQMYEASERSALFIMFKPAAYVEGTDNGWVYGTVSADGKTVTSAGRIESCMNCHQDAPNDRLFGLPQ